jgi:hypothetical protein
MYLWHHWGVDLLGDLLYSAFVFSMFYRSLLRIDKAYAFGVSGGNGWQRLFEGMRLQYAFDTQSEKDYELVMGSDSSTDEESVSSSIEQERKDGDLEAAWVEDLGATWTTKDPTQNR